MFPSGEGLQRLDDNTQENNSDDSQAIPYSLRPSDRPGFKPWLRGSSIGRDDPHERGSSSKLAVEFCRTLDAAGELDELGLTFGECVNLVAGSVDQNQNRFFAGICGAEIVQEDQTGTTNKGQCIQVARELSENED